MQQPLKTCCLCCSLETGAYVLSGFGLFRCLITICLSSLMLEKVIQAPIPDDNSLIIRIVGAVISIALYIMLIVGTKKRNSCLLLPFIILYFFGLCVQVVVFFFMLSAKLPPETKTGILIGYPIGLAIAFYIWLCMLSLYAKMRNDKSPGKVYNQYDMKI